MFGFGKKQWVCTQCGYNLVNSRPRSCPFCSGRKERLIDAGTASRRYRVRAHPVCETVSQLRCEPELGIEHAAYRIEADGGCVWIDCPSAFNADVEPVDAILFTHKDFIGAANQYREAFGAEVCLHAADAELSDVARHSVTKAFDEDVVTFGVRGFHIGGHTPGFTVYVWQKMLFVCDYAYPPGPAMKLNPHGPRSATLAGACRLADIVAEQPLETVCGYNYVTDFPSWQKAFMKLL